LRDDYFYHSLKKAQEIKT